VDDGGAVVAEDDELLLEPEHVDELADAGEGVGVEDRGPDAPAAAGTIGGGHRLTRPRPHDLEAGSLGALGVGGHVELLDHLRQHPAVAERVDDGAVPGAVRLVLRVARRGRAGGDGTGEDGIDIGHGEVQEHGRATEGLGRADVVLRVLVGQHHPGGADGDLGVADAAVVADDAQLLDGAERLGVPVEGADGARDREVGDEDGGGGDVNGSVGCGGGGHGAAPLGQVDGGQCVERVEAELVHHAGAQCTGEGRPGRLRLHGARERVERIGHRSSSPRSSVPPS
jgi:hypothetical protein